MFLKQKVLIKVFALPFLFLVSLFLFLSFGPKVTPNANAAFCGYTFPPSVAAGSSFQVSISGSVGHNFQAGIINGASNAVGGSGTGIMPTSGPLSVTVTAPTTTTNGPYQLLASDITPGDSNLCISNNIGNSTAISITGGGGDTGFCGYTFTASVPAEGSISVSISGFPGSSFQAGVVDGGGNPVGSAVPGTMPASGPLSLTVTAPSTAGAYQLLASDLTVPTLCVSNNPGNSMALTVTSGVFPFTLKVESTSGNTVTFRITPTPGSSVLVIKNSSGVRQLPDPDATGNATPQWTGADGTYTAVLSAFATDVSKTVSFTLGGGGGKNWNDPGAPAPPFNIMDVFQPAKRFGSFGQLASDILLILVSLAGGLALIFIIISGFKFVTSSGDEKKLASARATLTYAIIGIAVVILAFVIVQVLQYFLQSSVPIT